MSRRLYTFLLYLLLPFTPLKLLWRAKKQPEYLQHWRERYGFYSLKFAKPAIWLHCVSVGETRAAEPLIKLLLHKYPNHQILLTHTTPTGRATSEQLFGDLVARVYLPYDLPFAVGMFLKHFRPVVGVLMETELWFNLIAGCKQYDIPLLLVNARLSEKSAIGYGKIGAVVQQGLQSLSAVGAQTSQDAERLQNLSAHNVSIIGNLKFDVLPPDNAVAQGQLLRSRLGERRPILLAASTREGEEALIIDAVTKANIPNLLTIIVPRHPQRFEEVAALIKKHSASFLRRSALTNQSLEPSQPSYFLGDSMGEMFTYYAACDVAFIGGSLLPLGGQNLIEALSLGKPVLIGPYTFNFAQVTELAIAAGAAQRVQNTSELANSIKMLFADFAKRQAMSDAALSFSTQNRGATQRTLSLIAQYLRA
ncbi:MAG: lipid IV(A) 3-deoxy-D-manno-octulosonic acid transferase [Methylotenera sp.]|nr:lipid IV(A) 3-deoxy-D-manno-octulosonic acid transferase [Methylotenera sp.]MDO9232720.1 lipid IV(A) 3-deoxy-D-manno-octulosonic acid transferase [Methylotenera sp.]MDO9390135.1 lipid IV(A) 3-deoxy-D-manno-octulosonic acid transferase [Methylotenera sp.]MDP2404364.1 lipid IV(A) 3-deoxy-D-manno-octulosonic acid transferase [Methylotenera sp.]MDP3096027.1 lipid IV(A) 3-deoxy-D-manno-octulosonic acid transferase [Methylotenera sp.]